MSLKFKYGLALTASALLLAACSRAADSEPEPEPEPELELTYQVRAGNFAAGGTGFFVELKEVTGGDTSTATAVPDAVITVNGGGSTSLPEGSAIHQGTLDAPLRAGEAIELEIVIGDVTITGTNTVPLPVTVTSPTSGDVFTYGDPLTFEWTITENPSWYNFLVLFDAGNTWNMGVDGAERSHDVQFDVSHLAGGNLVRVQVIPVNAGEMTGPLEASYEFQAENREAAYVEITVNTP